MNTLQELINNGFDKAVAFSMLDNYTSRIGSEYGCWKLIDINYDFNRKAQMWTMECQLCGVTKTIKRPKLRDISTTCDCQKIKKSKKEVSKAIYNNDASYLGKIYGNDKIIGLKKNTKNEYMWICECQLCGKTHNRVPAELKSGVAPRCICQRTGKSFSDLVGKKNNFLTVIVTYQQTGERSYLICECDCGNIAKVNKYDWEHGIVKSCGCMRDKLLHDLFWKEDALNRQRLYGIWGGMKQRCCNPNSDNYPDYGGRGIVICDEWLESYEAFKKWALSHGYSDELSIDRIDNDGNYEPSNCRWATMKVQANNRRPMRRIIKWTVNGETKDAKDWCKIYGISYETVMYRINHKGMSVYEALTAPKMANGRNKKGCIL